MAESAEGDHEVEPIKDGRRARNQAIRSERRAQILDAMYAVMAGRGLAGASVSEIADAAGIARGALHHFFDSKAELTASLIRRLGDKYLMELHELIADRIMGGRAGTLVADVARWHFKGDEGDALRRMSVWIAYWGHATTDAELRRVVREIQAEARNCFGDALVHNHPELRALSPEALDAAAAALLALVEGGLLQWRIAAGDQAALDRRELGRSIAIAADAYAASIRVPLPEAK